MSSISTLARPLAFLGISVCAACAAPQLKPDDSTASAVFYTLTAEIALSRHDARVAALQYAAAAAKNRSTSLLRRATQATADCLQPSLTVGVAARWLEVDPAALEAHRAVAKASLELGDIEQSAAEYRLVLDGSPLGSDAEFAAVATELTAADNIYGARQVADRLATFFPASLAALRLQAFAELRADDPAAAVRTFEAALAAPAPVPPAAASETALPAVAPAAQPKAGPDEVKSKSTPEAEPKAAPAAGVVPQARVEDRRDLTQGLWRARILSGDQDQPLAQARAVMEKGATEDRLDYALLLLAAQQNPAARAQLTLLSSDPAARPMALRLLGLIDFQQGDLADAGARFAELVTTGRFLDDGFYYLGLIAERHQDFERALRLYAQVQDGDDAVPALLRAATILRANGAASASDELLDQLVNDEPRRAPEILVARAHIDSDAGDVPQAFAVLQQAELEYPDSVELRYAEASMSEQQGRLAAALKVLKDLAERRPADPAALNAYAYTLADHHRHLREARRLIEQAYAAAPKNSAILDSLGWVLFRQGHDEEAVSYLSAAYADQHDGDTAAHLGEVLWQLGRRADAENIWSEASRTDADNHLLKSTLERLHASK